MFKCVCICVLFEFLLVFVHVLALLLHVRVCVCVFVGRLVCVRVFLNGACAEVRRAVATHLAIQTPKYSRGLCMLCGLNILFSL